MKDWVDWHRAYDDPASSLRLRLVRVQAHLARAIHEAPPGPISLVSLCAGQGRDVVGVLPRHPRRDDVSALLVEIDPLNADHARRGAAAAGLSQVSVRLGDAGVVANFADVLPADVLLLAGIFGNVSNAGIRRTIGAAAALCSDGATVIWTRHRRPPDITDQMRGWFAAGGFDELAFDALETETMTGVGLHRFARPGLGAPGDPDQPLFSFGS